MNKKEKYYNYIIDDMVKKTEIDYDRDLIKLPYLSSFSLFHHLFSFFLFSPSFSNHVRKVYGVHDEEIKIIWDLYKQRINELINNE